MEQRELLELIDRGRETRQVEMKASMDFSERRVKAKIAKAAMAMANTRDGGLIILGMREIENDQFDPEGVTIEHQQSMTQDRVSSSIMEFLSPYVQVAVKTVSDDERPRLKDKVLVVVEVREFDEVPILRKRQYQDEGLREGGVYIRSFERNESREVQTEAEMRELIDLATEKRLRKHLAMTHRAGGEVVSATQQEQPDAERFRAQLEEQLL